MRVPLIVSLLLVASAAGAQPLPLPPKPPEPRVVQAEAIAWQPASAPFPERAEMAILFGDPFSDGLFTVRLRFPAGVTISDQWATRQQHITVLEGELGLNLEGQSDGRRVGSGGYAFIPAMKQYSMSFTVPSTIQITGPGPYAVELGRKQKSTGTLLIRSVTPMPGSRIQPDDEIKVVVDYAIENFRPTMFDLSMQFEMKTKGRSVGCPVVASVPAAQVTGLPRRNTLKSAKGTVTLTCSASAMLAQDVAQPLRVRVLLLESISEISWRDVAVSDVISYK